MNICTKCGYFVCRCTLSPEPLEPKPMTWDELSQMAERIQIRMAQIHKNLYVAVGGLLH